MTRLGRKPELGTPDKSRRLVVPGKPGQTEDRALKDLLAEGVASNAVTALAYFKPEHGSLSLSDMVDSLNAAGAAVNAGDMASAERLLVAQVAALNAIFCELARRASLNMGEHLEATDRYMRLALKAQSQARATLETLAAMKNPPVVFARQANINHGGQQQVNNEARTPAREKQTPHIELLEAQDGERLDPGEAAATSRTNQDMAPVGAGNRAAY